MAKNPHATALAKLGASKGGKARAKKLTKKRRVEIARKAAQARWAKPPHPTGAVPFQKIAYDWINEQRDTIQSEVEGRETQE